MQTISFYQSENLKQLSTNRGTHIRASNFRTLFFLSYLCVFSHSYSKILRNRPPAADLCLSFAHCPLKSIAFLGMADNAADFCAARSRYRRVVPFEHALVRAGMSPVA